MPRNRIIFIDQLKGFAIFLVVLGHVIERTMQHDHILHEIIYSFHMALFMMVSGLVAYKPNIESFMSFFKKKFTTLMFPFIFVGLLYTYTRGYSWELMLHVGRAGYWFLYALFEISILFFIFTKVSKKINSKKSLIRDGLIIIIIFVFLGGLKLYLPKFITNDILGLKHILGNFHFFMLGVLISKYQQLKMIISKNYIYTFCLLGYIISFYFGYSGILDNQIIRTISRFTILIVLYNLFNNFSKTIPFTKKLTTLGVHSLEIYVFHYFFIIDLEKLNLMLSQYNVFISALIIGSIISSIIIILSLLTGFVIKQSKIFAHILLGVKLQKEIS